MNHGSLFSGIGGFDLAAHWMGWNNIFHCECNLFAQDHLKRHWPKAITYNDITKTDFTFHRGNVDILTGGFPCQDASIALQVGESQQGLQGKRTGLFFEMCRAIAEIQPKFVVAENVANLLKTNHGKDFSQLLTELARLGYNAEWRVCRASEIGAPHHRARLYLVAYTSSYRLQVSQTFFKYVSEKTSPLTWSIDRTTIQIVSGGSWKRQPPALCLDNGIPTGLVRKQLHGYGNAIVPQLALRIFKAIEETHLYL